MARSIYETTIRCRATLSVTASLLVLFGACREPATVIDVGPTPQTMVAVSPQSQTARVGHVVPSSPTVVVTDTQGHPVNEARVLFSSPSSGTTQVVTSADGMASTPWQLGIVAGTQTLVVTVRDSKVPSVAFTAIALADSASTLTATSTMQVGVADSPAMVPPSLRVVDRYSNGIAGIAVTFEVTNGSGDVSPAMAITDSNGRATVARWTLGPDIGANTLVARALNLAPMTFTAVVNAPLLGSSVVAGAQHSCAIALTGEAYCWGVNDYGQVNTAAESYWRTPQRVGSIPKLVSIAAGLAHSCGISDEVPSQAYCWGANSAGQLGASLTSRPWGPVQVSVLGGLTTVVTGELHSCGLTTNGDAYCWGEGNYGQLGDGGGVRHGPQHVAGTARFTALAAGKNHTCGLTSSGELYCWGLDAQYQLGFVSTERCAIQDYYYYYYNTLVACARLPTRVSSAPPFVAIAAGEGTCGLTAKGEVHCYGLATNADGGSVAPVAQFARLSPDANCAVDVLGVAYCWSQGIGSSSAGSLSLPMVVSRGPQLRSIAGSHGHQCAVQATDSAIICWGLNDWGQLGNGTTMSTTLPLPVARPAGSGTP